jgi:hypothetical protein
MTISRCIPLIAISVNLIGWLAASGAPIGMPPGSKVWMKFEAGACPDADGDDCLGSNQAGTNPPNGIPLTTFGSGEITGTGYAEILPGGIRTFISGRSVFMSASFEDTYTVGGTATGPFDIPIELHLTGMARSRCDGGPASICHQLVGASAQAEIGTFSPVTEIGGVVLNEGFRVTPFDAQSGAFMSLPTESAGAPFERPIDVTSRYTVQNLNVGDTFVIAYGMNSSTSKGEVDLLNTGILSFDLPPGVFLTSALAQSLIPEPNGLVLVMLAMCLAAMCPSRRRWLAKRA